MRLLCPTGQAIMIRTWTLAVKPRLARWSQCMRAPVTELCSAGARPRFERPDTPD